MYQKYFVLLFQHSAFQYTHFETLVCLPYRPTSAHNTFFQPLSAFLYSYRTNKSLVLDPLLVHLLLFFFPLLTQQQHLLSCYPRFCMTSNLLLTSARRRGYAKFPKRSSHSLFILNIQYFQPRPQGLLSLFDYHKETQDPGDEVAILYNIPLNHRNIYLYIPRVNALVRNVIFEQMMRLGI